MASRQGQRLRKETVDYQNFLMETDSSNVDSETESELLGRTYFVGSFENSDIASQVLY